MINLNTRSRNIKSILRQLKPIRECKYVRIYFIKKELTVFTIITKGMYNVRYLKTKRKDGLSGLMINIKEVEILINDHVLFSIKWFNTYYTIEFNKKNPYITIIVGDINDLKSIVEGLACIE